MMFDVIHRYQHHKVLGDNKMQSETADFAPGAAACRTGRNIRVIFDSGPFTLLCEIKKFGINIC